MENHGLTRLGKALVRLRRVQVSLPNSQDITVAELNAMLLLVDNEPGSPHNRFASEMAQTLQTSKAALSQMMNSLEERGFLRRDLNPENRRKIILTLTPMGQVAVKEAQQSFFTLMAKLVQEIGEEKAAVLTELMEECADLLNRSAKQLKD